MKVAIVGLVGLFGVVLAGQAAHSQEGLATSSTIGGHNTIQQAPSGGRPGAGTALRGDPQGISAAEERRIEKRNSAATQICKGC